MLKTGKQFIEFVENLWDSESLADRILGFFLAIFLICVGVLAAFAGVIFLAIGLVAVLSHPVGAYSVLAALIAGLAYGVVRFWQYKKDIENDEE